MNRLLPASPKNGNQLLDLLSAVIDDITGQGVLDAGETRWSSRTTFSRPDKATLIAWTCRTTSIQ